MYRSKNLSLSGINQISICNIHCIALLSFVWRAVIPSENARGVKPPLVLWFSHKGSIAYIFLPYNHNIQNQCSINICFIIAFQLYSIHSRYKVFQKSDCCQTGKREKSFFETYPCDLQLYYVLSDISSLNA